MRYEGDVLNSRSVYTVKDLFNRSVPYAGVGPDVNLFLCTDIYAFTDPLREKCRLDPFIPEEDIA